MKELHITSTQLNFDQLIDRLRIQKPAITTGDLCNESFTIEDIHNAFQMDKTSGSKDLPGGWDGWLDYKNNNHE